MSVLKSVFKVQVLEEVTNSQWLFTILVLPPSVAGFTLLSFILTKEKALTGRECISALPNLCQFCETKFLAILSSCCSPGEPGALIQHSPAAASTIVQTLSINLEQKKAYISDVLGLMHRDRKYDVKHSLSSLVV